MSQEVGHLQKIQWVEPSQVTQLLTSSVPLAASNLPWSGSQWLLDSISASVHGDIIRALMGGQAQLSDSAVATVLQGSPTSSLYTCRAKGSVVMFGGVDKSYYQGVLNWVPLIHVGDRHVHMDR